LEFKKERGYLKLSFGLETLKEILLLCQMILNSLGLIMIPLGEMMSCSFSAGNKDIAVYTVDGRLILKAKGELKATLKKGVYKVLIGKERRTIIIR